MLRGAGAALSTAPAALGGKFGNTTDQLRMEVAMDARKARAVITWQGFMKQKSRDIAVAVLLILACSWLMRRVAPPEGSPLSRAAPPFSGPALARPLYTNRSRRHAARSQSPLQPLSVPLTSARNKSTAVDVADRRAGAVLGSFVADAASMGLHWIYDTGRISKMVGDKQPEFFSPPACPFYKYSSGEQSPYGDEELFLLRSVVDAKGVDGPAIQQALYKGFKAYKGRLNSASTKLVLSIDKGCSYPNCAPNDDQAHGLVKVAVVTARYAGTSELSDKVEEAVRAHQSHPLSVSTAVDAAKLLEHVILFGSLQGAIEWALKPGHISDSGKRFLENAQRSRHSHHTAAVRKFGQTCHLPGSFESMLHGALSSSSYEEAVRKTIVAGGDNCSRATLLGALFGAQGGVDSIPTEWRAQVRRYDEVSELVQRLLSNSAIT